MMESLPEHRKNSDTAHGTRRALSVRPLALGAGLGEGEDQFVSCGVVPA
jgi:hypothetical protein